MHPDAAGFLSAALAFEVVGGFAEGLQGVVIEEPAQEAEGYERHDEDEQEFFEGHGRFGLPAQVEVALRIDFLKELVFQVFDEVDGFARRFHFRSQFPKTVSMIPAI